MGNKLGEKQHVQVGNLQSSSQPLPKATWRIAERLESLPWLNDTSSTG
jgi:hypothetical protein